jgi:hypothetical protein
MRENSMEKLANFKTPNRLEVCVAKAQLKLTNVRYKGKLKANQWNMYEAK